MWWPTSHLTPTINAGLTSTVIAPGDQDKTNVQLRDENAAFRGQLEQLAIQRTEERLLVLQSRRADTVMRRNIAVNTREAVRKEILHLNQQIRQLDVRMKNMIAPASFDPASLLRTGRLNLHYAKLRTRRSASSRGRLHPKRTERSLRKANRALRAMPLLV